MLKVWADIKNDCKVASFIWRPYYSLFRRNASYGAMNQVVCPNIYSFVRFSRHAAYLQPLNNVCFSDGMRWAKFAINVTIQIGRYHLNVQVHRYLVAFWFKFGFFFQNLIEGLFNLFRHLPLIHRNRKNFTFLGSSGYKFFLSSHPHSFLLPCCWNSTSSSHHTSFRPIHN